MPPKKLNTRQTSQASDQVPKTVDESGDDDSLFDEENPGSAVKDANETHLCPACQKEVTGMLYLFFLFFYNIYIPLNIYFFVFYSISIQIMSLHFLNVLSLFLSQIPLLFQKFSTFFRK